MLSKQPAWNINNGNTFIVTLFVAGSCKEYLGIRIANLQQWLYFSAECIFTGNVVTDLNV